MKKSLLLLAIVGLALSAAGIFMFLSVRTSAAKSPLTSVFEVGGQDRRIVQRSFEVQLLVDGRPLEEYYARGKKYVEAREGAEYEVRVRNPLPYRVAVALSVDGLNTIDARRTTAWNASKWVIEPHGTITVGGWQMSSERARRFYFTSERDSYGAKLGQTANLGVVSAVFFRELRRPIRITPPRPVYKDDGRRSDVPLEKSESSPSGGQAAPNSAKQRQGSIAQVPDDDYAATGIGRSVHNDVRWVNLELESQATGEVMIRYEYYPALVRLGILPRRYERPDPLRRREDARGFEDRRFSPEP
ncbi:MAG TPA: hypothetical protein VNO50_14430 [Pyrinomonadaceae bacterium]|nr:hypothetical protein [Pyrinomonadaceae bacterium]